MALTYTRKFGVSTLADTQESQYIHLSDAATQLACYTLRVSDLTRRSFRCRVVEKTGSTYTALSGWFTAGPQGMVDVTFPGVVSGIPGLAVPSGHTLELEVKDGHMYSYDCDLTHN